MKLLILAPEAPGDEIGHVTTITQPITTSHLKKEVAICCHFILSILRTGRALDHRKKNHGHIFLSTPAPRPLTSGTLERQKSDEDFESEVSAKEVLSRNNCLYFWTISAEFDGESFHRGNAG